MPYTDNIQDKLRIDRLLVMQHKATMQLIGSDATPTEAKNLVKIISRCDKLIRKIDKKFFPSHKDMADTMMIAILERKSLAL